MLYILKIKGTNKIPDFVQIRDSEMTLVAYFRLSQIEQGLRKNGFTCFLYRLWGLYTFKVVHT